MLLCAEQGCNSVLCLRAAMKATKLIRLPPGGRDDSLMTLADKFIHTLTQRILSLQENRKMADRFVIYRCDDWNQGKSAAGLNGITSFYSYLSGLRKYTCLEQGFCA